MARIKFRFLSLILETCECFSVFFQPPTNWIRIRSEEFLGTFLGSSSIVPILFHFCTHMFRNLLPSVGCNFVFSLHAITTLFVSDPQNFTADSSSVCDFDCRAYEKLAHLKYCLLQKTKAVPSLPLIGKWEKFMLPNH